MTKKELTQKKKELCELYAEAVQDFKKLFEGKKEELNEKAKSRKKS